MKKLKTPIYWIGGKGLFVKKLLSFVPVHHTYVEVFGGGANLLFAKRPSPVEIYNDLDSNLVNFFRVLRDQKKLDVFIKNVSLVPFSREEFYRYMNNWKNEDWKGCDDIKRACRWFVINRLSFGGNQRDWGFSVTAATTSGFMAKNVLSYLDALELLPEVSMRLRRVQVENSDFRKIFDIYDTKDTFFYCDPPYIWDDGRDYHEFKMDEDAHQDLIDILCKLKGLVVLSAYNNELYEQLVGNNWNKREFKTTSFLAARTRGTGMKGKGSAKKKVPRTEVIWISPNCRDRLNILGIDDYQ